MSAEIPRRFALIGHGRIGAAVVALWQRGLLADWHLEAVLVRTVPPGAPPFLTADRERLFAARPAVIVEAGGPGALAQHGEAALAVADVWTVSAAALADASLQARLERAARAGGHRLRVLAGAIAGLDGVAMSAVDPACTLALEVELLPDGSPAADLFAGSVREAATLFPHSVNVAAAAALAGPGLDASTVRVRRPGPVARNRLALRAEGCYGTVTAAVHPRLDNGAHPVAAAIVAALRQQLEPIWVG